MGRTHRKKHDVCATRGLGTALLEMASQELCRRDYEEVSLTVTDLNAGAVRLYQRLEFKTIRTFGAFTWQRR